MFSAFVSPCGADKTLKYVFASTGVTITPGPSCISIDDLKASVKAIYSARLTRISTAVTY